MRKEESERSWESSPKFQVLIMSDLIGPETSSMCGVWKAEVHGSG